MSHEGKTYSIHSSMNNHGTCIVCYKNVYTYSIGMCDHPVCYECSTRMRVLCQQNECPICRQDLPHVVFTKEIEPFLHLKKGELFDSKYNIYFDDVEIQEKFNDLLAHVCNLCKEKQVFNTFVALKDHMRRKHEFHYCDLCVENLKIFSRERRCYSRADLAQHRRKGDTDDKSHKGHPLCEFCDCRYMDNDQLFRHLRRDHLYCHFCDADGLHQYYNSYDCLRDHFRLEHYLCEEGPCADEKFTSVFRTDIDLKAHKASVHGKHLGKAAAKQARTLELEFTLAPRSGIGGDRSALKRSGLSNSSRRNDNVEDSGSNSRDVNQRDETNSFLFNSTGCSRQLDVESTEEFPSLGNSSTIPHFNQIKRSQGQGNITIRGSLKSPALAVTDENFPALSGSDSSNSTSEISKTVNFSIFNTSKSGVNSLQSTQGSGTSNVSIHVNHKISDGTITTKVSGPNIRIKPSQLSMNYSDFPALSTSSESSSRSSTVNIGQWTKVTCSKPQTTIATGKSKKLTSRPASINLSSFTTISPPVISSGDAFPSLPNPSTKSKKASSSGTTSSSSSFSTIQSVSSQLNRHQVTDDASTNQNTASSDTGKGNKKKKKKRGKGQTNESDDSKNTDSKSHNESKVQNDNQPSCIVTKKDSNNKPKPNKSAILNSNNNNNNNNSNNNSNVNNDAKKSETLNSNRSKQNSENTDITNTTSITEITNSPKKIQAKSTELPRKRSELKIDNLNKVSDNVRRNSQDSLVQKHYSNLCPTNPPPGFNTSAPPPPGFAVKLDTHDAKSKNDGGLTFTNSLGESYSILPDEWVNKSFNYLPPPDFQRRNKYLVTKISQVLDRQESIEDFRYISGLFRQGACTAEDYYRHCRDTMGISAFGQIFPEMLVLLPDLPKQRMLFELFKKEFSGNKILQMCATCSQIVKSGDDLKSHYTNHTLDSHFPALAGDQATGMQNLQTWVRKNT